MRAVAENIDVGFAARRCHPLKAVMVFLAAMLRLSGHNVPCSGILLQQIANQPGSRLLSSGRDKDRQQTG